MSQVLVLGAGIVGICCALSLRRRGHEVTLLDRSPPASETSHGNAGVIAKCAIHPLADPALWPRLPGLALNRDTRFLLEYADLPGLAPWLFRFARNMNARSFARNSGLVAGIATDALERHRFLMRESGTEQLLNPTGWLKLLRTPSALAAARASELEFSARGIACRLIDPVEIRQLEPDLKGDIAGGLWMTDTHSVTDPAALARGYLRLFLEAGGNLRQSAVTSVMPRAGCWRVCGAEQRESAEQVVIAMGAWSNRLLAPLGVRLPIAQERGYHMMFKPASGAHLNRSLADPQAGFVMTPMREGIRVTTGCNLAARERAPNPVQLKRLLPLIRQTFPVTEPLLEEPWMGRRSSTANSLPIIGAGGRPTGTPRRHRALPPRPDACADHR